MTQATILQAKFDELLSATRLAKVLSKVEWGYRGVCPCCRAPKPALVIPPDANDPTGGHYPKCELRFALNEWHRHVRVC